MADPSDISGKIASVERLLRDKFGVRSRGLAKMLKRTGRRLPRRMHARAQVLLDAHQKAGHPKLARQMDMGAVGTAYDELVAHLNTIDVAERRKGVALRLAGAIVFNVLFVLGVFVLWLWWRGYI